MTTGSILLHLCPHDEQFILDKFSLFKSWHDQVLNQTPCQGSVTADSTAVNLTEDLKFLVVVLMAVTMR